MSEPVRVPLTAPHWCNHDLVEVMENLCACGTTVIPCDECRGLIPDVPGPVDGRFHRDHCSRYPANWT